VVRDPYQAAVREVDAADLDAFLRGDPAEGGLQMAVQPRQR
jgi:hypothetical protein